MVKIRTIQVRMTRNQYDRIKNNSKLKGFNYLSAYLRYVAKNIVAARLAEECLVQLAYCIGLVDPVSVMVNTYGTGQVPDDALSKLVQQVFPLSPQGTIEHLRLRQPIYRKTAAYGHFGRKEFAWEQVDATEELQSKAKRI